MADYIYLLENRLSPAQRSALLTVRELAKSKNLTVFLVGGAVRDLTTGSPVRDLDVVVQGNACKLKKDIERLGGVVTGEFEKAQSLFVAFPGGVRMEIGSTLSVTYPKPGKPVHEAAGIQEDLRRRDFTANAMALSLNDGSYGLLMDPLNGIADIENRELRLVSNYGFIEDPSRMIRATRLMARLGWTMDEKTAQRYQTGKEEGYISALSEQQRGYETEEIFHEEDPLRVFKRLESEGWMTNLAPFWTSARIDVPALERLREVQTELQMQGIHPDPSTANFPLLTAKLSAKEVATLKESFVRPGFVREVEGLEAAASALASTLGSKASALPSQSWKLLTSAAPEAVLWVAYSTRSSSLQAKFKAFLTTWPQAKQKIPYVMMQEMRIVPELAGYNELLETLFFELMDDKLQTVEEMKAFLEPFSPPAPPPPVSTRRPRAPKKESKAKARAKKAIVVDAGTEGDGQAMGDEIEEVLTEALADDEDSEKRGGGGDDDSDSDDDSHDSDDDSDSDDEDDDDSEDEDRPVKAKKAAPVKAAAKAVPVPAAKKVVAPAKKAEPVVAAKKVAAKAVPVKAVPAKKVAAKAIAVKAPVKSAAKAVPVPAKKSAVKVAAHPVKKAAAKQVPAKKAVATKVPAKKSAVKAIVPAKKTSPAKVASKKAVPAKKRR